MIFQSVLSLIKGVRDLHSSEAAVTIISVCFESSAIIGRMLQSVPAGIRVILIDNGSTDFGLTMAIARQYGAKIVSNTVNHGFGTACNQGAAMVGVESEFLFFLNPDVILTEQSVEMLCLAAQRYPDASAFGPAIFNEAGRLAQKQSSVLLPRNKWIRSQVADGDHIVPVLSGSALFVRRHAFNQIGGFDQEIFMYHEDDDLCLRLEQHCGPLMFVAGSRVIHTGGHSSIRTTKIASLKGLYMGRSRVYASLKHGRPLAFPRALVLALRQLASPISWLSARRRAKNWGFLQGVLSKPKSSNVPTFIETSAKNH